LGKRIDFDDGRLADAVRTLLDNHHTCRPDRQKRRAYTNTMAYLFGTSPHDVYEKECSKLAAILKDFLYL